MATGSSRNGYPSTKSKDEMAQHSGAGGPVTDDGCPVLVYTALPDDGESAFIARWCPADGSVLDLGAGTGRIADPLAQRGLRVVAVDSSPDMLAHVRDAERVHAGIESLRLDERFDVVLLASHLVNTPDPQMRRALVATASYHLRPDGRLLLQWHPPQWFDTLDSRHQLEGFLGPFHVVLTVHDLHDGLLDATVSYSANGSVWEQRFAARQLSMQDLTTVLTDCGVPDVEVISEDGTWLSAQRRLSAPAPRTL
jgi:SAM-dependent methyltransferase